MATFGVLAALANRVAYEVNDKIIITISQYDNGILWFGDTVIWTEQDKVTGEIISTSRKMYIYATDAGPVFVDDIGPHRAKYYLLSNNIDTLRSGSVFADDVSEDLVYRFRDEPYNLNKLLLDSAPQTTNVVTGNSEMNILSGTMGSDKILGLADKDLLIGLAGNDFLDGGIDADIMKGGPGNDIYIVDNRRDTVIEQWSEGIDLVETDLSEYYLGSNVEDLVYKGKTRFEGKGNELDNVIIGGNFSDRLYGKGGDDELIGRAGNDKIYGGDGDDFIQGGAGADTLRGGRGNDEYIYTNLTDSLFSSYDQIKDWEKGDKFLIDRRITQANFKTIDIKSSGNLLIDLKSALTNNNFVASGATLVRFNGEYKISETFLAINDDVAGFQEQSDAIIKLGQTSDVTASDFTTPFSSPGIGAGTGGQALNSGGGMVQDKFGGKANAAFQQKDGKILVTGSDYFLARYNADGTIDTSLSFDGKVFNDWFGADAVGNSVIQQEDGELIVAGTSAGNFIIGRYQPDGTFLQNLFARSTVTDFGGNDQAKSVIQQRDGKLVVAGSVDGKFGLARYDSVGNLDASFGVGGKVITDFGFGDTNKFVKEILNFENYQGANRVIQLRDGKLLAVGSSSFGDYNLARYNEDGSLDVTFGNGGKITHQLFGNYGVATSAIEQSDGKIVVGGMIDSDFCLIRFNVDGSVDKSFDGDGLLSTDFGPGISKNGNFWNYDIVNSIVQQSDGKLVAAGSTYFASAIARYNIDGSLDKTFDGDGMVGNFVGSFEDWINYPIDGYFSAKTIIQQDSGKLVAVGSYYTYYGGSNDSPTALVRYNTDGTLDTGFGSTPTLGTSPSTNVVTDLTGVVDTKRFSCSEDMNGLDENDQLNSIIWQNSQNGDVVSWTIQDNAFKSWGFVGSTGSKLPWQIETQGDFDSTPGMDIVWKNSSTGAVYIWSIANNTFVRGGTVGAVDPASGWDIVASANFNNDPYSDLLWQNSITNDIYIWNIHNNAFSGSAYVGSPGANSGWQAKAVGEFDGKGNTDILWQNKFSGDVYIWNITNNQFSGGAYVGSVGPNSGWEIKDTGFFNNDNYSDILWQNTITGDVYIWDIVDNAISDGSLVGSVGPNSKWDIQNAGLYNADSFSDILWHNSGTGEAFIWNITNNTPSGFASLGAPSTQWGIAPVNSPII